MTASSTCSSAVQEFIVEQSTQSAQELQILGTSLTCPNENTNLSSSLLGDYIWSTGETTSNINVNTAGIYTLSVTLNENCFASAAIEIKHYPQPQPEVLTWSTCSPDGLSYYVQIQRSTKYEFSINEGEIRIGTDGTFFVYVPLGKRLVLGVLDPETGCQHYKSFGAPLCTPDPPMRVSSTAKVTPNPFTTSLTFQRQTEQHSIIYIFDINGRLVLTTTWATGLQKSIDLSEQASGIYFYKIFSSTTSLQGKVLKIRANA